jgi:hypothetical protein
MYNALSPYNHSRDNWDNWTVIFCAPRKEKNHPYLLGSRKKSIVLCPNCHATIFSHSNFATLFLAKVNEMNENFVILKIMVFSLLV